MAAMLFSASQSGETTLRALLSKLKRRSVFRVGAAYAVVSWLIIQVIDIVFPRLGIPDSATEAGG